MTNINRCWAVCVPFFDWWSYLYERIWWRSSSQNWSGSSARKACRLCTLGRSITNAVNHSSNLTQR